MIRATSDATKIVGCSPGSLKFGFASCSLATRIRVRSTMSPGATSRAGAPPGRRHGAEVLLHPSTKLQCSGTARIGANMKAQTSIPVESW